MAKSDQLLALIKSQLTGDKDRFYSIVLQIAAHEANLGHEKLARELKEIIDKAKSDSSIFQERSSIVKFIKPKGELENLLSVGYTNISFSQLSFSANILGRLARIIKENKSLGKLRDAGLSARRKILLYGPPGTGKTITASALAHELGIPLFTIHLDGILTKYMGESASKLRIVFDAVSSVRGVYLFDEFDAIGADRGFANDVGEIRRILNSFLQFLEKDHSDSIVIASTNYVKHLDYALARRFDDVIEYSLPDEDIIEEIIKNKLAPYHTDYYDIKCFKEEALGLSHAEIVRICNEAIKDMVITGQRDIDRNQVLHLISERKEARDSIIK